MVQVSFSDLYAISHDRGYDEEIRQGDVVRTGPNAFPQWEVIAVHGEKAWVRNTQSGQDGVTEINRCRRVEAQAAWAASSLVVRAPDLSIGRAGFEPTGPSGVDPAGAVRVATSGG